MITRARATVEDLYKIEGKAEIINGEIVLMSPTGARPGRGAGKIFASLNLYEETHGGGYAFSDNVGFIVDLPNRTSFSPDAAWCAGAFPAQGLKFAQGAPAFAVEVRSEEDYGASGERKIQEKIRDYFAAGTLVVWDVDLVGEETVRVYRASAPDEPVVYRRGEEAEAEPAVPDWRFPVDRLFS